MLPKNFYKINLPTSTVMVSEVLHKKKKIMQIKKVIIVNCKVLITLICLTLFSEFALSRQNNVNASNNADTNTLKRAFLNFTSKVDSGKYSEAIPYYDTNFLSIRVVDAGQFIRMGYKQMVRFWNLQSEKQLPANTFRHQAIITQRTTIHYMEVLGDTGYILLTRIKDLGNGPEPMFYNLIWIRKKDKWYLLREIVHQRTMPNVR